MKNSITTFKHPFLSGMDKRHLQIFFESAAEEEFETGDIIFHEGEPANRFYLIDTGKVALESTSGCCEPAHVQTLGAGDALGWSWLFPPFVWHYQARVLEPTHTLCCNGGHLLVTAEEDPVFGYDLMKRVSQILIRRLQATRDRFVKDEVVLKGASIDSSLVAS